MLERIADRMENPSVEVSSDYLMHLHFDKDAELLERFVSSPTNQAEFRRFYPAMGHLIDAAVDMIDNLKVLHTVRQEIIEPHLNNERKDVVRERKLSWKLEERAEINGLTVDMQSALEAALDPRGFVVLTSAERKRLADEIRAGLDGDPNT